MPTCFIYLTYKIQTFGKLSTRPKTRSTVTCMSFVTGENLQRYVMSTRKVYIQPSVDNRSKKSLCCPKCTFVTSIDANCLDMGTPLAGSWLAGHSNSTFLTNPYNVAPSLSGNSNIVIVFNGWWWWRRRRRRRWCGRLSTTAVISTAAAAPHL